MWLQTMGMAVMLDEIINYVQSLQNQVEVSLTIKDQILVLVLVFVLLKQLIFSFVLNAVPIYEANCSKLFLRLQLRDRWHGNNAGTAIPLKFKH